MSEIDSAKTDEGASYYRYRVSLRVWQPTGDPQRFTAGLGLAPDVTHTAGQPIVRRGRADRIAEETYWLHEFAAPDDAADLEDFLANVVTALHPHGEVFASVRADGGDAELFIGYFPEHFNCGFALTPALMQRCAECGLTLRFDIYGYCTDAVANAHSDADAGAV